jgi:hypothetical protein
MKPVPITFGAMGGELFDGAHFDTTAITDGSTASNSSVKSVE